MKRLIFWTDSATKKLYCATDESLLANRPPEQVAEICDVDKLERESTEYAKSLHASADLLDIERSVTKAIGTIVDKVIDMSNDDDLTVYVHKPGMLGLPDGTLCSLIVAATEPDSTLVKHDKSLTRLAEYMRDKPSDKKIDIILCPFERASGFASFLRDNNFRVPAFSRSVHNPFTSKTYSSFLDIGENSRLMKIISEISSMVAAVFDSPEDWNENAGARPFKETLEVVGQRLIDRAATLDGSLGQSLIDSGGIFSEALKSLTVIKVDGVDKESLAKSLVELRNEIRAIVDHVDGVTDEVKRAAAIKEGEKKFKELMLSLGGAQDMTNFSEMPPEAIERIYASLGGAVLAKSEMIANWFEEFRTRLVQNHPAGSAIEDKLLLLLPQFCAILLEIGDIRSLLYREYVSLAKAGKQNTVSLSEAVSQKLIELLLENHDKSSITADEKEVSEYEKQELERHVVNQCGAMVKGIVRAWLANEYHMDMSAEGETDEDRS